MTSWLLNLLAGVILLISVTVIVMRLLKPKQIGRCHQCNKTFRYRICHNGFGDTAYAYCDKCGMVSFLSGWFKGVPKEAKLRLHQCITHDIEPFLQPCTCGGHFKSGSSPRCPHCSVELSAELATDWIERNAPGTKKGWRWQRNWTGLYSIVIEERSVQDNWREPNSGEH